MKLIHPLKIFAACVAAVFFQILPSPAAVLVNLDLSGDTAHNTGSIGDGTVNINTNGFWENANATGDPAGRAFNTGSTGMGTSSTNQPNVGTISWTNSSFASSFNNSTQITTYLWLSPDTTPGSTARALYVGDKFVITLTSGTGVNVFANSGGNKSFSFSSSPWTTDEWTMLAVTFNSGVITVAAGKATDTDLTVLATQTGTNTTIGTTGNPLVVGNQGGSPTNPFDGAIGGFYLATDLSLNLESTFDAQKANFIAVPEPSSLALGGMFILAALAWKRRRA